VINEPKWKALASFANFFFDKLNLSSPHFLHSPVLNEIISLVSAAAI
jgi:hypothetical protein